MKKKKPYWLVSIDDCWYVYKLKKFIHSDHLTDEMRQGMTTMKSFKYIKRVMNKLNNFVQENPDYTGEIEILKRVKKNKKLYFKCYSYKRKTK